MNYYEQNIKTLNILEMVYPNFEPLKIKDIETIANIPLDLRSIILVPNQDTLDDYSNRVTYLLKHLKDKDCVLYNYIHLLEMYGLHSICKMAINDSFFASDYRDKIKCNLMFRKHVTRIVNSGIPIIMTYGKQTAIVRRDTSFESKTRKKVILQTYIANQLLNEHTYIEEYMKLELRKDGVYLGVDDRILMPILESENTPYRRRIKATIPLEIDF